MGTTNAATEPSRRLRALIDERGLRYTFVAAQVGITPSHLTRLMDGERPLRHPVALAMAELLGVPVEQLLGGAA